MPQLSIPSAPGRAFRGMLADASHSYSISRRAEGADVSAGMPVIFGTTPAKEVKAVEAGDVLSARTFAGWVVLSTSRPYDEAAMIEEGDSVSVLRRGTVMGQFSAAVTAGQQVALTVAAGTFQGVDEGAILAAGQIRIPRSRILETTSAAGFAKIAVDVEGWTEPACPTNVPNIPLGPVAYASIGTDAAGVAGTVYYAEHMVPAAKKVTGVAPLNGTSVGTDRVIVGLYDEGGHLLATSDLAGTLGAGADGFQEIALTAPLEIPAGRYFVATQFEGTTHATQRIAANTYRNRAGSVAGTFGTLPATITPPTTITAGAGPVAYLY